MNHNFSLATAIMFFPTQESSTDCMQFFSKKQCWLLKEGLPENKERFRVKYYNLLAFLSG